MLTLLILSLKTLSMTDYTELKRLAAYHVDLHGDTWYSEESLQLESIPTFSAEAFIVVASPAAVLALIAENDSARKHWQNESNNVQALMAEVLRLKAEISGLKTGYQAYERVNAELKAENEALLSAMNEILRVTPMGVEAFDIAALVLGELSGAALGQGEQS